ncbi:WXG100-like domain-containing protein, partial [Streptomyces sp. YIM 132580]|uniref:WXG100-like domain-containing protein n=1 Tax=Streptomyces sp. YIM 132580 TaxID=2691958 RepID=UPI003FCE7D91
MIFILTGEKLMDADEDLAFESRGPYSRLGRKVKQLSALIDKSVHDIGESMPDDLAESYRKAMGTLIDDGGKNYLKDFAGQLDKIAEGRRKTSMDIMESKWQVIAEIIRLLIEIAIYLAMSFFTGGASASQIMLAKMRSRFFILTTLSHLLQRLHLTPSLTEAFAEAFTTFAVRLAMMNFAPNGRRPDSIDWSDIGKAAAFGAAAGFFTSIFENVARNIVRSFDGKFLKNGPDLDFKNPNWRDTPNIDIKGNGPTPNPKPGPEVDLPKDRPGPELNPPGNGPGPSPNPVPVTFRDGPLAFRNNPELWRNSNILRFNLDRPGVLAGRYGIKGTVDFIAAGAGEVVGEILIKGAFEGDWSSSWTTFVGAGVSSRVESTLMGTALNSAAELRHVIDKMRLQQPPTVSGGASDSATRGAGNGPDRAEGPPRTDGTGGGGDAGLSSPPPVVQQTTGQGDFSGSQSPPPYVSQDPPPYFSADPPPYTPGPLPVTAAENALWQQVHQGPAEVREQALRELAALRGTQTPGPAEIGVRDGVHERLSQLPEIRVVPTGNTPAGQVDTDAVRRALESFGTPVTVDTPIPGPGAQPSDAGSPGGVQGPVGSPTTGTPGGAGTAESPVTEPPSVPDRQNQPGPDGRTTTPPQVDTSGSYGDTRAPGEADGGPGTRDLGGDAPVTAEGPGTQAPPLTVVVSEGPPPLAASPEATALLDGAGVDRAVVLGPPTGTDATGQPVRDAVELTREGPGAPVEVRPLTGPGSSPLPDSGADTAFPGANVLLPLADALGVPPVMPAAPPPTAPPTAPPASSANPATPPPRSVAQGGPTGDNGAVQPPPRDQAAETTTEAPPETSTGTPETSTDTESGTVESGTGPRRTESGPPVVDPSSVKVVSGEPAPLTADLRDPDVKPTVITTTGSTPGPDVKPPPLDTTPEAAPDAKPPTVTTTPDAKPPAVTTTTEAPVVSKHAADARPWTGTATDVHLESGRGEGSLTATPPPVVPPPGQIIVRPVGPAGGQGGTPARPSADSPVGDVAPETEGPRPTRGETPSDPDPQSRRDSVMEAGGETPGPATTSTTDADGTPSLPATGPSITPLTGEPVPFDQLRRFVPQTAVTPQPGVAVRTLAISQSPAEDGTERSAGREALLGQDTFRGVRTTSAEPPPSESSEAPPAAPRTVFTGPPTGLPGSGTARGADYFVGHGTPRTVTLGTDIAGRPTVKVSGVQLGELLKHWAREGDQDRPLVLFSCETGQQPRIAGLPVAQHVANRTGRPVYAPTTEAGTAKDRDGNVRAVLAEGPDGPGRWRLFTPEPTGTELDDLARDAGLHAGPDPADAFARARTLQQIRTLRDVLGPDAEQRPGHRELLAGLAYVDGLRWRGPGSAARYGDGRMTPGLLDRMVTDWHTDGGRPRVDPGTGPTRGQYTAFLEAAAGLRAAATPATTLDSLLPPPPPAPAPGTLVSQSDVLGLSYARSAQIAWSLSDAPLPLSDLDLGPDDTAELARRLHRPEPTEPSVPPAPSVPQEAPPTNSLVVNAYTARHTYGIPEKNFDKFRDVARNRNVVVDVRPTNPSAPKWLDAGALPKPPEIKAKTV